MLVKETQNLALFFLCHLPNLGNNSTIKDVYWYQFNCGIIFRYLMALSVMYTHWKYIHEITFSCFNDDLMFYWYTSSISFFFDKRNLCKYSEASLIRTPIIWNIHLSEQPIPMLNCKVLQFSYMDGGNGNGNGGVLISEAPLYTSLSST